jgi:DNA-binding MarR family transcriptional regulator
VDANNRITPERQQQIAEKVLDDNPDLLEEWGKSGHGRADRDLLLLRLRAEGRTVAEMAEVLEVTRQSVLRALRRLVAA